MHSRSRVEASLGKVVASRARRVVRDVTSSLASMSLASRIDGIDAKLSHEFAAAFGDAVCDELEREGDEAVSYTHLTLPTILLV